MRIEETIKRLPKGKVVPLQFFKACGSESAVRSALSRLVKNGKLVHVARGVYARPKPNRFFGTSLPQPEAIARVIADNNGELIAPHGAEIARRLGLSTQMSMRPVFYTTGRTREVRALNSTISFVHAPVRLLRHAKSHAGLALLALHYLGKVHVTLEVLTQLNERVPVRELQQIEGIPAWMSTRLKQLELGTIPPIQAAPTQTTPPPRQTLRDPSAL